MLTPHGLPCHACMVVHATDAWRRSVPGGVPGSRRRPGMLRTTNGDKGPQRAGARRQFPARRLHLVDIENLAGDSLPSLGQVREVQDLYTGCLGVGAFDQVVIASSHLTLLNAALGWPHARYRVRSGPNGADLELLDVLLCEDV